MNNLRPFLVLLIISFTFSACIKDEVEPCDAVSLDLVFKGNYAGETLLIDELTEYSYFDNAPIRISNVRFFISDVTLLKDGVETAILDVADVDFTQNHRNPTEAAEGQSIQISNLEAGEYDGIRFGIGLNATQNASIPSSFAANHPLGNDNNEYWGGWNSYIFSKVEGRQDINEDTNFESFTYHIGFDQLYRSKAFSKTISLNEDDCTTELVFNVDVQKLFTDGTTNVDIVNRPVSHSNPDSPEDWANSNLIMDGFVNAIDLE